MGNKIKFVVKSVELIQIIVVKNAVMTQIIVVIFVFTIYYYINDRGSCEINFVIDDGIEVTPIEVKAETNLRAKSLKTYCEKYTPNRAIRTSMADYKEEDTLINLPLYAIEEVMRL